MAAYAVGRKRCTRDCVVPYADNIRLRCKNYLHTASEISSGICELCRKAACYCWGGRPKPPKEGASAEEEAPVQPTMLTRESSCDIVTTSVPASCGAVMNDFLPQGHQVRRALGRHAATPCRFLGEGRRKGLLRWFIYLCTVVERNYINVFASAGRRPNPGTGRGARPPLRVCAMAHTVCVSRTA